METASASDYLEIKKRKQIDISKVERSASSHITNKQYFALKTTITMDQDGDLEPSKRFQVHLPIPTVKCLRERKNIVKKQVLTRPRKRYRDDHVPVCPPPMFYPPPPPPTGFPPGFPPGYPQPPTNNPDCTSTFDDSLLRGALLDITQYLDIFAEGNFEMLNELLTVKEYTRLTEVFYLLKEKATKEDEIIRQTAISSLKGMFKSLQEHNKLVQCEELSQIWKIDSETLRNREKLKEYIAELNRIASSSLFGEHDFSVISATISQEHTIYIDRYGFPEHAIFDPDLLGAIVSELSGCVPCNPHY